MVLRSKEETATSSYYLYSDKEDFKLQRINDFVAIAGEEEDTFYLCYTADLDIVA